MTYIQYNVNTIQMCVILYCLKHYGQKKSEYVQYRWIYFQIFLSMMTESAKKEY
jgi:hypothetical protein